MWKKEKNLTKKDMEYIKSTDMEEALGKEVYKERQYQKKKDKRTTIALSLAFIFIIFLLIYIKIDIKRNNGLIQEQIDYIQIKDNLQESNMEKLIEHQEDLTKKVIDLGFEQQIVDKINLMREEMPAPFDHIKKEQIVITGNKIIIQNKNINWAEYTGSGSMNPILTSTANGIEIKPRDVNSIHVGDIISYYYNNELIVHRVVKIGVDDEGWYAITKADNLQKEDPIKIRFNQINGVLIGVIY